MPDPVAVVDFARWGAIEWKITLGEILNVVTAVGLGYYVGKVINRRLSNDRSSRDLVVSLCNDCFSKLNVVAGLANSGLLSSPMQDDVKQRVSDSLTAFSNSIVLASMACKEAGINCAPHVDQIHTHREALRERILDALVVGKHLDPAQVREVNATILRAQQDLVRLQLACNR